MKRWQGWMAGVAVLCFWSGFAQAQMIWWESGMVKLRRANSGTTGDPVPAGADLCSAAGCLKGGVALSAGRNEFEPFQILIAAPSASDVSQVDVTVGDLKDAQGDTIIAWANGRPKNVVLYREHYLSIDATHLSSAAALPGLWPDALVPKVDEYFGEVRKMPNETSPAFPFNVAADQKQGVWVDLYVPPETPAGLYIGAAQVTIGGAVAANIPIRLTVRDFDLPSTPTLKTAYALGIGEVATGHYGAVSHTDSQYWELICLYTKEMLLHRVSNENLVWPAPKWDSTLGKINWSLPTISTTCNQRYPEFLTGGDPNLLPNGKLPGAKVNRARMRDGTGLGSTAVQSVAYYKDYIQHFIDMGWKPQLFYYLWDEPPYPLVNGVRRCDLNYGGTASTAWSDLYNKSKFFKDNALDVPILVTTDRQSSEDCFVNYLKVPDYTRYLDVWTVPNKHMEGKPTDNFPFNANLRGTYDTIIAPGKELWWYQACGNHGCGGSETGYATPMADLPAIYSRIYEWLTYRYQIGDTAPGPGTELYFETVYAYQFSTNDPWQNIFYFGGNGDGTYFYPGRPDKIGGTIHIPIPSIRMKMLREGIEDYEYLAQVEAKKNGEGIDGKEWIKANILDPYLDAQDPYDGTTQLMTYVWNPNSGAPTSSAGLLRAREELAKVLSAKPDFTLAASPASATVVAGSGTTATLSIASLDGLNGTVGLACAASNPTVACGLNPLSVTPPVNGTAASMMSVTTQGSTPAGSYRVTVSGASGGLLHQATFNLTVQAPIPTGSISDTFDRTNSTNLGSNWNEYLPDFEVYGARLRNADAAAQEAEWLPSIGPDQDASVDCKTTAPGNSCGVMARWSDPNNFYYARIDAGLGNVALFKKVGGAFTRLAVANRPMTQNSYYRIRLVVKGTALSVYFGTETTPAISLTDASLAAGNYAGIRSYAAAAATTWFDNFNAISLSDDPPPAPSYSDTFDRANGTNLGSNWNEYLPDFEVYGAQLRNADAAAQEAEWLPSIGPDQDASVDCKTTASGNSCGVMARWSDPNNFYYARIDAGLGNVALFKKVGGAFTRLAVANRPMTQNSYYRIRLVVKGTALSVYFGTETTPAISLTDASLAAGNYAGIRSYAAAAYTTWFDNFNAAAP